MPTVLLHAGLRFVIFFDDHQPAHVHAFGDGQAKINLVGADGKPKLVWADGMTRAEMRRAMRVAAEHQERLLAAWERIHG